ncbi:MAG: hypothetical protein ACFFE8_05860 [Candidatus Heimdallarchaeota archaeon]
MISNSRVLNASQIQSALVSDIEQYRKKMILDEMVQKDMEVLIDKLLLEREILMTDLADLKEILPQFDRNATHDFGNLNLLLSSIDEKTYNDFFNLSNKLQMAPGKVLSSLMKDFIDSSREGELQDFSTRNLENLIQQTRPRLAISNQEEISVSRQDLIDLKMRIDFKNIKTMNFESDVDLETFNAFVGSISNCNLVRIPNSIPILIIWSKSRNCSYYQVYDSGSEEKKAVSYAMEANEVVEEWKKNLKD